jgi:V/A-type H+-transporting ATPase subunit E
MSNLDNLTQKILDDARDKAEKILKESAQKNEEIVNSKVNEAKEISDRIIEKANIEANMITDRIISNAELRARDEKLKAKQNLIEKVFAEAKDRLKNINEDDYIKFVSSNIKAIDLKGTEEIVVPDRMKGKVRNILNLNVFENESIDSGFLIRDNDIIINFSFDSLVDYLRDELEGEIAKELFNEME